MSIDARPHLAVEQIEGYETQIRSIFRSTFLLGKPFKGTIDNYDLYESMSIDWYLHQGRDDCGVMVDRDTGVVQGYVLVCTKPNAYDAWNRSQALRVFRRNILLLLSCRMSKTGRQFYWRRFLDAFTIIRSREKDHTSAVAHVHMNVLPSARTGLVALALWMHADVVCRKSGITQWTGEINAIVGTRENAIRRLVGEIISIKPNRTATFFAGEQVNRITVRRTVPSVS